MFDLKKKAWPLVWIGFLFAAVEVISLFVSDRFVGSSRSFAEMAAMIVYLFNPEHYAASEFFQEYEAQVTWSAMVALGIILGSFVSAVRAGKFRFQALPEMWKDSKGNSVQKRLFWVFISGVLMAISIRIVSGCTLSMIGWTMAMTPAGWLFMGSLWMGGILTTFLFYNRGLLARPRR